MNPNIQIESIYATGYLNLISQTMKDMKIPQTIDEKIPYDAQCLVSPGEVVQMIVMDMLTGRQALVHMAEWATGLDVERLLRPGVQASFFNDDANWRQSNGAYWLCLAMMSPFMFECLFECVWEHDPYDLSSETLYSANVL